MNRRRVVVTGMGLITPVGLNKYEFWNSIISGKSGVGPITRFDASAMPTRIAAELKDFNPEDFIPRREARRMDRFVQYACAAAVQALKDADLTVERANAERIGVWVGSGIGGMETLEKQHDVLNNKGAGSINPFFIPMLIPNMASGQISILTGAKGPNGCTVTACATASSCIGEAYRIVQYGQADVMITGGAEASITPLSIAGFCAMKAMSTRNDEPEKACRPFDLGREGFVMGEGAGVIILEEMEHAVKRGARIYAEIIGYGCTGDACHMVQPEPEGEGAARALQAALDDAGIKPEEVDYINAHGTGTKFNDEIETLAIKKVFGEHAKKLAVSSTKAVTGHMLGAAGAVELAASILACQYDLIPPTMNLENSDPKCDLDYVPGEARRRPIEVIVSENLGFGGHNAALVARKCR